MKILLSSHAYAPSIGGIETMSAILAQEFAEAGHEVWVVTQTPDETSQEFPHRVLRKPTWRELMKAVKWSDVVFHNNISLQTAWPLAFVRRPWVVAHHTWIRKADGNIGRQEILKRWLLRFAKQIAISEAIARDVNGCHTIIGNCYDSERFRIPQDIDRNRDIVFVGRLVSDKGADLAVRAVAEMRKRGLEAKLTIVGGGEEEAALEVLAAEIAPDLVCFTGPLSGDTLVEEINRHKVMVVPSLWKEPFGIVALEGIACGCVVVGSDGGGLKDAIGPCGLTFPNGDLDKLVEALESLLTSPTRQSELISHASDHLAKHAPEKVAARYLEVLSEAAR